MHCPAPPPKPCIPQEQENCLSPCSEASLEPAQSRTSDTSLVFTSLNQTVYIFPGFPPLGWHHTSPCSQPGATGLHKPLAKLPDTSKGLRWPYFYSHPGDTVACFLPTKRKDLFAACTQTVLNAQEGGKFSNFFDPANSLV